MHQGTDNLVHAIVVAAVSLMIGSTAVEHAAGQAADSSLVVSLDTTKRRALPGPEEVWRAGVYALLGRSLHSAAKITGLPGVPNCCDGFYNGAGSSWDIGFLAELPLSSRLRAGWRLGVSSHTGQLTRIINEEVNADRSLVVATIEHSVSSSQFGLTIEPYLGFAPLTNLLLRAGIAGSYMLSTEFSQVERLVDPEGITYSNGRRTRMEFSGPVEEANRVFLTIRGGIRYDLSLNRDRTWMLAPEAIGWYGLSDMIDDTPWRVHGIRVGASLQRVAWKYPKLPDEDLDVIFPIRSGPVESPGTEEDKEKESGPESDDDDEE